VVARTRPVGDSLLGLATIGRSIERAEKHGPNDPATRPERFRRAERMTVATFGAMLVVAVAVSLATEGVVLAVALAVLMPLSLVGGIWAFRRWLR
jgi:hypothetical protein